MAALHGQMAGEVVDVVEESCDRGAALRAISISRNTYLHDVGFGWNYIEESPRKEKALPSGGFVWQDRF
jgi:hypothetical protein